MVRALTGTQVETHHAFWEGGPGTYMWVNIRVGGGYFRTVFYKCPNCGIHQHLAHDPREGPVHEPEEHDGKLTVRPLPSNSNSIKCVECGWHGYVYEDVWKIV